MDLGTAIKSWRKISGHTQRSLADAIGVSITTIRNWEGGVTGPNAERWLQLIDVIKSTKVPSSYKTHEIIKVMTEARANIK